MVSKPTFVSSKIFNENLVEIHKIKETLTLDRPAYVGMCILDLSKTLMYDFITIQSREHMVIRPSYYLRTLILSVMRSKLRMFIKTFEGIKICLISVITQKIARFMIQQIKSTG